MIDASLSADDERNWMEVGDVIRFRVDHEIFVDASPMTAPKAAADGVAVIAPLRDPPYSLIVSMRTLALSERRLITSSISQGSCAETGLGPVSWWKIED